MTRLLGVALLLSLFVITFAQTGSRMKSTNGLAAGYWPLEKSQPIIDKMQTIRLAPPGGAQPPPHIRRHSRKRR